MFREGLVMQTSGSSHDLVPFLVGCSFTFETALQEAGVAVRHLDAGDSEYLMP